MAHVQTSKAGLYKPSSLITDKIDPQKMFIDNIDTLEGIFSSAMTDRYGNVNDSMEDRLDKLEYYANIKSFGAIGDGVNNDSDAIQLAYSTLNAGDVLFFPSGTYKFQDNFPAINKGIKIVGENMNTVIFNIYSTTGTAFIQNNSKFFEISNISFYYPEQVRTNAEYLANGNTVIVYPPLIYGVGYYCKYTNLNIGNAYDGLKIGNATDSSSAVVVENIVGTPLRRGFYLDRCLDIPKIKDIHFNRNIFAGTDKELESDVYSWILNNGTAFAFGRVDWADVERLFEYGYKTGINVVNLGYTGSADFLTFTGCQFDNTKQPLVLNDFNSILKFQDCIFVGDNSSSNSSIDSQATTENLVIFDTCTFDNYANRAITVKSNSIFDKCNFTNFAKSNGVYEAIYLDDDDIYCKLNNSNFDGTSATNARALFNNDKATTVIAKNNNFKNLLQNSLRVTTNGKLIEEDSILNGMNVRNQIGFYRETHVYKSEAVPTSGSYMVGDIVINTKPTELGVIGSKYIITHWHRLTTGSNHVVGTDWVEEKVLIGNERKSMVNVLDFGAIGDGTNDDTTAIQNAINSLTNGGVLFFPYGKYKVTSTITINSYIILKGGDFIGLTDTTKFPSFMCYAGENDENTPQFKLDFASGMKGFIFSYPNQVATSSSTPTPYGYTIATDTTKGYNIDNVYLENLMLRNSYNGINLSKAGRFNIRNIYGQPFKNGLYIDRILDVARAEHIHFWTFHTTPGQNLYNWIKANGTAFSFGRIDGASCVDLFAYGYNTAFNFDDFGNGKPWMDLTNCIADVCNIPVQINNVNKVNFINGTLTTASLYKPCILTGSAIYGNITFNGTELSGGSGLGAKVSSSDGIIQFANVKWNSGSNGIKSYHLINESTCSVSITGCDIDIKKISGGNTTIYNGRSFPSLDTDITPANINTAANWTAVGTGSSITQLADGIDMAINTNSGVYYTFPIPTGNIRQNIVVLEFDYSETSQTDKYMLFRIVRTDGNSSNEVVKIFTSSAFHIPGSKIRVPFWIGEFIDSLQFRFEARTYTGTNNIQLRNIKVYKTTPSNLTNVQIDTIIRPKYLIPARRDSEILEVKSNGKKRVLYNSVPTTGDWVVGDEIELITPVAGGSIGHICTVAGTPGTWKPFGLISE